MDTERTLFDRHFAVGVLSGVLETFARFNTTAVTRYAFRLEEVRAPGELAEAVGSHYGQTSPDLSLLLVPQWPAELAGSLRKWLFGFLDTAEDSLPGIMSLRSEDAQQVFIADLIYRFETALTPARVHLVTGESFPATERQEKFVFETDNAVWVLYLRSASQEAESRD
ncbi:hypothetical protein [Lignipirellula cremea]|uniref:Uncharacterized protein n=1 Tax=Lignipirellula cremea TaxID=2528010 RepID=A0A518E0R3_9BACT|nr:hypothetical protein [Lignipirellula cremea]QDU97678.1 hypothetical protein Pla8534_55310 [Lignipirellula cremea]